MDFKLGRLPGVIPVGLRELPFYAAGALPKAPAKVDVPVVRPDGDGTPWGVLGNDRFGDCGVAGLQHVFMADASIAGETEVFPGADDDVSYYMTYTGGQDTGVVLSSFLSYVRVNRFYGHTVDVYAPVGVHDVPTLLFGVWAYGAVYAGIEVTTGMVDAFNADKPWTVEDLFSDVEGGHCVPVVGYDSKYLYVVTWGKVQPVSYPAWHFMSDEAWAVVTGEFVARGNDARGVSLDALRADLAKVAK